MLVISHYASAHRRHLNDLLSSLEDFKVLLIFFWYGSIVIDNACV